GTGTSAWPPPTSAVPWRRRWWPWPSGSWAPTGCCADSLEVTGRDGAAGHAGRRGGRHPALSDRHAGAEPAAFPLPVEHAHGEPPRQPRARPAHRSDPARGGGERDSRGPRRGAVWCAYHVLHLRLRDGAVVPRRRTRSGRGKRGGDHGGQRRGRRGRGRARWDSRLRRGSVEAELVALAVPHHHAGFVDLIGAQESHADRAEGGQPGALGLRGGESFLAHEPGAHPHVEVQPVLDDLALGHALAERARPHSLGVHARERPTALPRRQGKLELLPRRETPRRWAGTYPTTSHQN